MVLLLVILAGYYKYLYLPKMKILALKKSYEDLGYKVRVYSYNPISASQFDEFNRETESHNDCFHSLKSAECYDADILIHNILSKPIVEFVNLDLVKEYFMPEKVYTQKKVTFLFESITAILGKGLIFAEGNSWKNKRKVISSVFNFYLLKSNIPNMKIATIQELDAF